MPVEDATIDLTDGDAVVYGDNELARISIAESLAINGSSEVAEQLILSLAYLPDLPSCPKYPPDVSPPKPVVGICKSAGTNNLVLVWHIGPRLAKVRLKFYELWSCLEPFEEWKKMGDIPALTTPMSCILSRLSSGVSHFTVRAVDYEGRLGHFAVPASCKRN